MDLGPNYIYFLMPVHIMYIPLIKKSYQEEEAGFEKNGEILSFQWVDSFILTEFLCKPGSIVKCLYTIHADTLVQSYFW